MNKTMFGEIPAFADTYIALFSRCIACGTYEANYILDAWLQNLADVQRSRDVERDHRPFLSCLKSLAVQAITGLQFNIHSAFSFRCRFKPHG